MIREVRYRSRTGDYATTPVPILLRSIEWILRTDDRWWRSSSGRSSEIASDLQGLFQHLSPYSLLRKYLRYLTHCTRALSTHIWRCTIGYCLWQLFLANVSGINALLCFISDTQDLVSKPRLLLSRPRALLQFSFFRGFLSASRSILEIGYPTLTQTRLDPPLLASIRLDPSSHFPPILFARLSSPGGREQGLS